MSTQFCCNFWRSSRNCTQNFRGLHAVPMPESERLGLVVFNSARRAQNQYQQTSYIHRSIIQSSSIINRIAGKGIKISFESSASDFMDNPMWFSWQSCPSG